MLFKRILILLFVFTSFSFYGTKSSSLYAQYERKLTRVERRADRNFVQLRFEKAMNQYERVLGKENDVENQAALQLKMARLYFMIREYEKAISHYSATLKLNPDLPYTDDLCDYIDALRFIGKNKEAEAICLDYAFKDKYTNNQRYKNILDALSLRFSIHDNPAYSIMRMRLNTSDSEYWIGNYGGELFYALSYGKFNDPRKVFFHQTKYYKLDYEADFDGQKAPRYYNYFKGIPVDMQNGPLSFSPDLSMMVSTVIEYNKAKKTVEMVERETRPFRSKLYYSVLSDKQKKFKKYLPIFPQEAAYSYAHPFLFNDGKSLMFSSDMPGGYGGFDLYVTHWSDADGKWGMPVNLGAMVNTEGDEVYPIISDGTMIYSSNGLPGFGGYDLFSVQLDSKSVVPGSLYHYPSPINSVFNDYYMYPVSSSKSYLISDRGRETLDDIYFVEVSNHVDLKLTSPYYGMEESKALKGGELLLNEKTDSSQSSVVSLKPLAPEGLLITLYFDFDSYRLTDESTKRLEKFIHEMSEYQFNQLKIDGYADEIGNQNYNYTLSEKRANAVVSFMKNMGVQCRYEVQGHGVVKLTEEEINTELGDYGQIENDVNWIKINWKSRRVDIFNKRK